MENDFLNWYKTKFNELDASPPDGSWENISNELDLHEVWQGVNSELNKKDKRTVIVKITVALTLMVSLSGGLFMLHKKQAADKKTELLSQYSTITDLTQKKENITSNSIKKRPAYNKSSGQIIQRSVLRSLPANDHLVTEKEDHKPAAIQKKSKKQNIFITKKSDLISLSTTDIDKDMSSVNSSINRNNIMFTIVPIMNLVTTDDKQLLDSLIHKPLKDSIYKKPANIISNAHSFIVGIAFSGANTWLLNNDTYNGLKAGTLNQTLFSFGKAYNVLVGYNLSNKYCLQTEWVINNTHNQQYIAYKNGHQINRNLKADYTQVNLLMKKKNEAFYLGNKLHTSFNYLAGFNYSYVKSCILKTDETVRSVKNRYQDNQFGLILGLEYQIYITRSWIVSTGARTNIGLYNIYKGNNKTYDESIGLNVGITYQINGYK